MRVFRVARLLQVEGLPDEEMSAGFPRFTPLLSEAVLVIAAPGIELLEWGKLWMIAEQLDQGSVASTQQREEVVSDLRSKRLRSARGPGHIAITPLWKGGKLGGHSSVHSGFNRMAAR